MQALKSNYYVHDLNYEVSINHFVCISPSLYICPINFFETLARFLVQVFILIHVVAFVYYIKGILSPKMFKVAVALVVSSGLWVSL